MKKIEDVKETEVLAKAYIAVKGYQDQINVSGDEVSFSGEVDSGKHDGVPSILPDTEDEIKQAIDQMIETIKKETI